MIPHISYDLDGDGYVGGRDLVMAKHFDKDGDGKLNEVERSNAMKALANGYEDNFIWGIE
jgi:Ca2+-binding EF-hand superfamily protein